MSDHNQPAESHGLVRSMGLLQATALNMSNMVGVGVFVTIPLIIAAMGGPQCMLGWVMGAILALCDGLVWSELAAAMPGTGGTYLYLTRSVSVAVGVMVIALLYRGISAVGKLTVVLWVGMLVTLLWVIVSGFLNFNSRLAFDFPPGAFTFSTGFLAGFGSAMLIAMYDLLGYYDICYVGGEVRNPERVIPRSIIYSVIAIASMYLLTTLSIISVIPWREAMHSKFIASEFIEKLYGGKAAALVTGLVLWTAFASLFALLLGYSRIPYAAAINGHFFKSFGKLHPTGKFPYVSLLAMGGLSIVASLWSLDQVITALLTSRILVQFIGQIIALDFIRRKRTEIRLPFKMWLYPIPSIIAFLGWGYVFATSGWTYVGFGLLTVAAGVVVFKLSKRSAGHPTTAG